MEEKPEVLEKPAEPEKLAEPQALEPEVSQAQASVLVLEQASVLVEVPLALVLEQEEVAEVESLVSELEEELPAQALESEEVAEVEPQASVLVAQLLFPFHI